MNEFRKLINIISENEGDVKSDAHGEKGLESISLVDFLADNGIEADAPSDEDSGGDTTDEEQLDEAEKQLNLFGKSLPKQAAPKQHDKFDMGKWMETYMINKDENFTTENILMMAKLVGSQSEIDMMEKIMANKKKLGHLPVRMQTLADIDEKLWPKVVTVYKRWAANNPAKADAFEEKWDTTINEAKLGGVPARTFPKDELNKYLDRTVGTDTGKRNSAGGIIRKNEKTKRDKFDMPYIHNKNVPIVDEANKEYDLEKLRAMITKRPAKILKQNEKMLHSDGTASVFYNIGIPALKGLAVDEDTGEFVIIDTCPGAGACQTYCYAMKGGYIQYTAPSLGASMMLNFLYNDPDGFMAMLSKEIAAADKKFNKDEKKTKLVIRWHDAGDFFSPQYLEMAYNVARSFPKVDFYAYTKMASVAQGDKPDNFKMNYSQGAKPAEEKQIDFKTTKSSRVVPDVIFKDLVDRSADRKLIYKDEQSIDSLKQRIGAKYSVDPSSILTYDEMMATPIGKKDQYNVIVKPGDGDDSANRADVLNTFLLMH